MSPFLCVSLPPTLSACPISLTTELVVLIAPGAIARGLQSLIIMGFPRGLKDHPPPPLPPQHQAPHSQEANPTQMAPKNQLPEDDNIFPLQSAFFFFNMCVVCFFPLSKEHKPFILPFICLAAGTVKMYWLFS